MEASSLLREMFEVAVRSAQPAAAVVAHLPSRPAGRTVVVGAGKAAAEMAAAVDAVWDGPLSGVVVTRQGQAQSAGRVEVLEATHPLPSEASERAAEKIIAALGPLGGDDLVLALWSGGGSALAEKPGPGLSIDDVRATYAALLESGAPITDMNVLRRHLSSFKGGRLLREAAPARVVSLLVSDVPGDDPSAIASGPTVGDASTLADARTVVERHGLRLPAAVAQALTNPALETVVPADSLAQGCETVLVVTPARMLQAAASFAAAQGVASVVLGDALEGESREVGRVLAGIARFVRSDDLPERAPAVLLSGGETTVTLDGPRGRGGPNSELLLACALQLEARASSAGIFGLAADTDGIDGASGCAGAQLDPDTLARIRAAGIDPTSALANHDAARAFEAAGGLLVTGPTGTNVNDFRVLLVTRAT